jgi:protoheme IX farnesyltransferase
VTARSPSLAAAIPAPADLVALTKPGILSFSLLTCAAGMSLAPGYAGVSLWLPLLAGTAMLVGSANALNMYLEREIDCLMARTRNRPLPAGRMEPIWALGFGVGLAAISVPLLSFAVNPLTGFLGVVALLSYVLWYTPLKQRSALATIVGGLPGAMPPLLGWTAVTGRLDAGGLVIFGVLFLWQIPHFNAIALFRRKEYERAGLKTLPGERGARVTRISILLYSMALVQLSFMLYPLGVAGRAYLVIAGVLGAVTIGYAAWGARRGGARWARRVFLLSIVYLPLLFIAMVIDGVA